MSEEFACFSCKHWKRKTTQHGFTSVCLLGQGTLGKDIPKKRCAKLEKVGQQRLSE